MYPDASHSLTSVRDHFYPSMAEFLGECFVKKVTPEDTEVVGVAGIDINQLL